MELFLTISSGFGKSALGAMIQRIVDDRAKRGLSHIKSPIELERHLLIYPMDLERLLSNCGGTSNFADGNVPGIVGTVLTFHPYSQEVSTWSK